MDRTVNGSSTEKRSMMAAHAPVTSTGGTLSRTPETAEVATSLWRAICPRADAEDGRNGSENLVAIGVLRVKSRHIALQ